jgi:hypothetical protein
MLPSTSATTATLVKDLGPDVFPGGDKGLSSIAVATGSTGQSWLYAAYDIRTAIMGITCLDPGVPGNRSDAAVNGCPSRSAIVRFAIAADGSLSAAAQPILPRSSTDRNYYWCSQFGTGGIAYVASSPAGQLFVSAGMGANDNSGVVDVGQYGGNPCATRSTTVPFGNLSGAFRAMDPVGLNGKVATLVVSDAPFSDAVATAVGAGLNNPWRFAWGVTTLGALGAGPGASTAWVGTEGYLYTLDTGLLDNDEINVINPSSHTNFGFPCRAGPTVDVGYGPICTSAQGWGPAAGALPTFQDPLFTYVHAVNRSGVLSGIAVSPVTGRIWAADYLNLLVFSIKPDGSDYKVEFQGSFTGTAIFPVHLQWLVPLGATNANQGRMVYIDVVYGTVADVPGQTSAPAASGVGGRAGVATAAVACTLAAFVAAAFP